ncbi:hypothetical protein [Halobellus captivus]|uniref:hypothetical protein n=1 Tax=Halobellus captivus TaxID=2592614 RepID=UPI0011A532B8|nr:hypothetical protein [Halobellus captivus]
MRSYEPSEGNWIAQNYRHSDDDTASVLRELEQLKQLLDETRTERGSAYAAVPFLFLDTLSTMTLYVDEGRNRSIHADQPSDLLEPDNMEHLDQPLFLLGHGVENPANGIHGDEEYLYVVELPTRNPFEELSEWTVKVSGHSAFPRWDGPTDEAFERASWQFNGPLEHALEELVAEPA